MKMSEFLLKAARQLAERDDIVVDSLEGAKILEALRASLYSRAVAYAWSLPYDDWPGNLILIASYGQKEWEVKICKVQCCMGHINRWS